MQMAMPRRRSGKVLLLWAMWAVPAAIASGAVMYRGWTWMTVTATGVVLLHGAYVLWVTRYWLTEKRS